jgi:hypothetical protein
MKVAIRVKIIVVVDKVKKQTIAIKKNTITSIMINQDLSTATIVDSTLPMKTDHNTKTPDIKKAERLQKT